MSMINFLRNIAVCTVSLSSISYGADGSSTPTRDLGSAATLDISPRSSVSSSPSLGSYQRFRLTETTTERELVQALITAEAQIRTQQKNVKSFLRELARIMSLEGRPVSADSQNVKVALDALISNIKTYQEKIATLEAEKKNAALLEQRIKALEAEKKIAEAEAAKWHKRTYVGMAVSGIIVAILWEVVLRKSLALVLAGFKA